MSAYSVYRVLDPVGFTLYVGMTADLDVRRKQHLSCTGGSIPESANPAQVVAESYHDTKGEALVEEERLIRYLCPPYNALHNPTNGKLRKALHLADRFDADRSDAHASAGARLVMAHQAEFARYLYEENERRGVLTTWPAAA